MATFREDLVNKMLYGIDEAEVGFLTGNRGLALSSRRLIEENETFLKMITAPSQLSNQQIEQLLTAYANEITNDYTLLQILLVHDKIANLMFTNSNVSDLVFSSENVINSIEVGDLTYNKLIKHEMSSVKFMLGAAGMPVVGYNTWSSIEKLNRIVTNILNSPKAISIAKLIGGKLYLYSQGNEQEDWTHYKNGGTGGKAAGYLNPVIDRVGDGTSTFYTPKIPIDNIIELEVDWQIDLTSGVSAKAGARAGVTDEPNSKYGPDGPVFVNYHRGGAVPRKTDVMSLRDITGSFHIFVAAWAVNDRDGGTSVKAYNVSIRLG